MTVTMTSGDFLAALDRQVPEVRQVVQSHFVDYDELLLHVLTGELRRFAIEAFNSGQSGLLHRLLNVVNDGLVRGDENLENAVAVSFVEGTGWWDPAMQPFIESWPSGLLDEARRQERHSWS